MQVDRHIRLLSFRFRPWSVIARAPVRRLFLRSTPDLPYMYTTEGKIKEPNLAADIGQGLMGVVSSYAKKDMGGVLKGGLGILRAAGGGAQKAESYTRKTRTSPADVVSMCFSGNTTEVTCDVVGLLEWLQGFSNQRRYSGGRKGYGRYEPRGSSFPSRQRDDKPFSHF